MSCRTILPQVLAKTYPPRELPCRGGMLKSGYALLHKIHGRTAFDEEAQAALAELSPLKQAYGR